MWTQAFSGVLDFGPGGIFDVSLLRVTRMGEEGEKRAAIGYADINANAGFFLPAQAELDQLPAGDYMSASSPCLRVADVTATKLPTGRGGLTLAVPM